MEIRRRKELIERYNMVGLSRDEKKQLLNEVIRKFRDNLRIVLKEGIEGELTFSVVAEEKVE